MFEPLTFYVFGEPAGQPRIKARYTGKFTQIYTPTTVKNKTTGVTKRHPCAVWKEQITGAWPAAAPGWVQVEVPIMLTLCFNIPRPKSHFNSKGILKPNAPQFADKKPDADNYAKAVMDVLTEVGAWRDDAQVVILKVVKQYVQGGQPGCSINIRDAAL